MEEFKCTDIGNAERFQDYYKDAVRYIPELNQWVFWSPKGWQYAKIFKLSKPVIRNIYKTAAKCEEDKDRVELVQWGTKSESKASQRCMLDLAAAYMATSIDDFDNNPKVINCSNGIVDLTTKELLPHSPAQLHLQDRKCSLLAEGCMSEVG
jgi:putative DNA primase/helicase